MINDTMSKPCAQKKQFTKKEEPAEFSDGEDDFDEPGATVRKVTDSSSDVSSAKD